MKKIIAITTSVLLLICFSTISAHADRKTVEGFIIGTGVAILGTALINGINKDFSPQYSRHHHRQDTSRHAGDRYANRGHNRYLGPGPRGHWEIEEIWITPIYEKKWNPAHYNRRGEWVSGRHETFLVQDGYWQGKKMWVFH
ncbi:hypothetical protein [Desulfobacula sp.]